VIERFKILMPRPMRLVAVGMLATLAYSVFALCFVWVAGLSAPIASLLGHGLAGFVSYFGHRIYTFEVTGKHKGAPVRFMALNITSYFIACISPWLVTRVFMLPDTMAILITAMVLPAVNMLLIAKFVFRAPLMKQASPKVKISHGV
jgi:putative flippase GtrA